jgi:hypothetical protein
MKFRNIAIVMSLLLAGACSKKDQNEKKDDKAAPAAGSATTPTPTPEPAKPVEPDKAAAPAATGTKWLALDKLGIEAEAPACAEVTTIDDHTQAISPGDPSCVLPFPGATFLDNAPEEPKSLDEDLAIVNSAADKPPVLRKEKTATGWFIEAKTGEQINFTQRYQLGGKLVTCRVLYKADDPQAETLRHVCASARKKA